MRSDPLRGQIHDAMSSAELRRTVSQNPPPWLTPRADGLVDVTFVYDEGEERVDEVQVLVAGHRHVGEDERLSRLGDSPLHTVTYALRPDLLTGYGFVTRRGEHVRVVPDPSNPPAAHGDSRLDLSLLALPDAPVLPWPPRAARAIVEEHDFVSAAVGNRRRIWVSPPPEPIDAAAPSRVVIVLDGSADHAAVGVRDALSAAGVVRNLTVALVDPLDRRSVEMCADPSFSALLTQELLPWLQRTYGVSAAPQDVALSGSSFGGLCSVWTALHHPDAIGKALAQSPSCWWYPGVDESDPATRTGAVTPTVIAAARDLPNRGVRIYHECGATELGPPPASIPQILGNRWLHDVLTLKGYDTCYTEFPGGHDATWWRGTWGAGVEWLFGDGAA